MRLKMNILAVMALLVAVAGSAFAQDKCSPAVDPIRRIDGQKHNQAACTAAGFCWAPNQTECGSGPCPWCFVPGKQKDAPLPQPAACKDIDPLQRVAASGNDVQSCRAGGNCWAPTRVTGWNNERQPNCYVPNKTTQRCPAVATPNCVGNVATNTGQRAVLATYTHNKVSCQKHVCENYKTSTNAASCTPPKPQDKRTDCKKHDMGACNAAGCCWSPTTDPKYPWCYKP